MRISKHNGFTLVEVLIVVIILGILAAVVVPQFSTAAATAKASMLADDLRVLRTQIEVFKAQHLGVPPGYPGLDITETPTEQAFIDHMCMATTDIGDTASPGTTGYPFGPYMSKIAENPVNGKSNVTVLGDSASVPGAAANGAGWIYKPATVIFKADCAGQDDSGDIYFNY